MKWLHDVDPTDVYLSVVTLGEIRKGIELCSDPHQRTALDAWLGREFVQQFSGRIVAFEAGLADRWGHLVASMQRQRITPPAIDSLIAATALHHDLGLVTRNGNDFAGTGVSIVNPWLRK